MISCIMLQVSFPKLEELTLKNLPKLKDIWHHQLPFESFSNLQILRVYKCPCLLNLVPTHLIHTFQNLKKIYVQYCELLEHVIVLQEIDENVEILPKLETLMMENLPRLRWIKDGNDSMKYFSSLVTVMNIQYLKELHITNCRMEDLRKMQYSFVKRLVFSHTFYFSLSYFLFLPILFFGIIDKNIL